uniref:Glycosyl transferase family 2 n=1 Tax=Mimiviridae sp. ChoanoV1 TaxID=2596887 RepID=A0A5B8HY51_9VIRU|nr:hypothetical protein 4_40 [Mimiviridae sp. ChoanoV1]
MYKNIFFTITLLLLILLIYRKKNLERFSINDKKVAIVSMVTKQPDFKFWLQYHLDFLKIDKIFLRIEDSPEYKFLIEPYGDRVEATFHNKEDIDMKHNYLTIMDRQKKNVNDGIVKAKKLGMDYIFHCDADELIYIGEENGNSKSNLLRKFLDGVPKEFSCIHMKNFEAVFPNLENKCFNTNKFIDCKKGGCLSYANGKSAGRLSHNINFKGPHYFTGLVHNIEDTKLCILHFDSCTYKQWENKFNLLKDTTEEKMKKIPFPFYKNSIKNLKSCNKKDNSDCKDNLVDFYKEQKIIPYNKRVNLVDKKFS